MRRSVSSFTASRASFSYSAALKRFSVVLKTSIIIWATKEARKCSNKAMYDKDSFKETDEMSSQVDSP